MGVTKQAAQKRFVPKEPGQVPDLDASEGFARFTPLDAVQDAFQASTI